jgi:hypothetical protein
MLFLLDEKCMKNLSAGGVEIGLLLQDVGAVFVSPIIPNRPGKI